MSGGEEGEGRPVRATSRRDQRALNTAAPPVAATPMPTRTADATGVTTTRDCPRVQPRAHRLVRGHRSRRPRGRSKAEKMGMSQAARGLRRVGGPTARRPVSVPAGVTTPHRPAAAARSAGSQPRSSAAGHSAEEGRHGTPPPLVS